MPLATPRDLAALEWVERRAAALVAHLRRRRKRMPRGPLTTGEVEILRALIAAEAAARRLREVLLS